MADIYEVKSMETQQSTFMKKMWVLNGGDGLTAQSK